MAKGPSAHCFDGGVLDDMKVDEMNVADKVPIMSQTKYIWMDGSQLPCFQYNSDGGAGLSSYLFFIGVVSGRIVFPPNITPQRSVSRFPKAGTKWMFLRTSRRTCSCYYIQIDNSVVLNICKFLIR
jgi:hypothetical protein